MARRAQYLHRVLANANRARTSLNAAGVIFSGGYHKPQSKCNHEPVPLAGINVVKIAQNIAWPYASEILAMLGADVVKIGRPGGGDAYGVVAQARSAVVRKGAEQDWQRQTEHFKEDIAAMPARHAPRLQGWQSSAQAPACSPGENCDQDRMFLGTSLNGRSVSNPGSFGIPSTRSAMILR